MTKKSILKRHALAGFAALLALCFLLPLPAGAYRNQHGGQGLRGGEGPGLRGSPAYDQRRQRAPSDRRYKKTPREYYFKDDERGIRRPGSRRRGLDDRP